METFEPGYRLMTWRRFYELISMSFTGIPNSGYESKVVVDLEQLFIRVNGA